MAVGTLKDVEGKDYIEFRKGEVVITVKESNGEEGIIIDVFRNGELLDSKTIWYNEYVKCQTCEECLTEYEKERYGNYCSKCAKTDDW